MSKSIEIVSYTSEMTNDIAAFFADLVDGMPHIRPLTTPEIDLAVSGNERRKNQRIQPEEKLVALSGTEVVGLALFGKWRTVSLKPSGRSVARFLGYKRGWRRAGQLLIDAVESYAREHDVNALTIFSRAFPFTRSRQMPALSNHLAHIESLLTANGYVSSKGHILLEWQDFSSEPIPATCPLEFRSETAPDAGGLPALRVTSYLNGSEVGVYFSLPFHPSEAREGEGPWLCVNDVDVVDAEQGKRFGWLTLQRGLYEASKLGYRSAIIGTNEDNGPALSLYSNMGFKPVDWTYDFLKNLNPKNPG